MKKYFLIIFTFAVFIISCTVKPQKFDSEKWKTGSKFVRGSMIYDLDTNRILQGKTKAQIEELLGSPNESQDIWLGYDVVTNARCYFWKCRMEINLDPQTKKSSGIIAVSD